MRILLFTLLATLGLGLNSFASAATFKIATLSPDGSYWMKTMKAAAQDIAEKTDKRVKFRFYPGGVMGNDKAVLKKMRIGQLHGAAFSGGALATRAPDSQIYSVPMLFQSEAEVDFIRAQLDKDIEKSFGDAGFISFGLSEGGFGYILSKKRIESVADLQGKKAWVPTDDVASQSAVDSFGVAPVSLSLSDVLTGLQTGLIDTVAASPIAAIALQWHSQVNYVLDFPIVYIFGLLAIDQKAFKRLSAEDQQIVDKVMRGAFKKMDAQNRQDNQSALSALENQNIQRVLPSDEQQQEWRIRGRAAEADFVERGRIDPQLMSRVSGLLDEFRASK